MKQSRRNDYVAGVCHALLVALIALVSGSLIVLPMHHHLGRVALARQIAEGTHKVEWTRNDFGTLEVRIVEVDNEMETKTKAGALHHASRSPLPDPA